MAKGKYQEWLQEENLILLKGWARDGLVDEQIAHNMGITTSTFYEWKKKYAEISEALKESKEVADRAVENALYKSALGAECEEITEERIWNRDTGQFEMVVTKRVTKRMPPNSTSLVYWLKNRKPEVWRDRQEIADTDAIEKLDAILGELRENAETERETE